MGIVNPQCWVQCLDCNHRELVRRSVIDRRSQPRCGYCGGPVEVSDRAWSDLRRGAQRYKADKRRREGD